MTARHIDIKKPTGLRKHPTLYRARAGQAKQHRK